MIIGSVGMALQFWIVRVFHIEMTFKLRHVEVNVTTKLWVNIFIFFFAEIEENDSGMLS